MTNTQAWFLVVELVPVGLLALVRLFGIRRD